MTGQEPKTPWIVTTLAEVAEFFGLHPQSARRWRRDGMPGRQGAWDLSQILTWREARTPEEARTPRERFLLASARLTELRKDRLQAALVDVEAVRRLFAEHVALAESVLAKLPDDVLEAIPPNTPQRRELRSVVAKTAGYALQTLQDALNQLTPS